jgi:hypothetical protein
VSRARRNLLIAVATIAFLAISVLVARVLSAAGAERDAVITAIEKQVGGGSRVEVVRLDAPTRFALTSRTGVARIVWKTQSRLPTVQCVRIRRSGDPLSGFDVSVLAVSRPIGREQSCKGRRF